MYKWTPKCQGVFEGLKKLLITWLFQILARDPCLQCYCKYRRMILYSQLSTQVIHFRIMKAIWSNQNYQIGSTWSSLDSKTFPVNIHMDTDAMFSLTMKHSEYMHLNLQVCRCKMGQKLDVHIRTLQSCNTEALVVWCHECKTCAAQC